MATMRDEIQEQEKQQKELLKELARLEIEIHNRGELTHSEVYSFLCVLTRLFLTVSIIPDDDILPRHIAEATYTRIAALLSLWASCDDIHLTPEDVAELTVFKDIIASIFYASGYRGTNHLKSYLVNKTDTGALSIPQDKLIKYFIFVHIDDIDEQFMQLAKQLPPEYFVTLLLGWANTRVVLTEQGERNIAQLFSLSALISKVQPNYTYVSYMLNAWMHSSYRCCVGRETLKANINRMLVNYFKKSNVKLPDYKMYNKREFGAKPRLLIIHERVKKDHAMYRCYFPLFKSLKNDFELYSMADENLDCDELRVIFSKHYVLVDPKNINESLRLIEGIQPDIIYYPSLGMSHWTIILANLRLAKMQVMTGGHPDSSFSPAIDFFYLGMPIEGAERHMSENLLVSDDYKFIPKRHSKTMELISISRESDQQVVHIAANCNSTKLSADYIKVLFEIKTYFRNKICLHFFPADLGIIADGVKSKLHKFFPDAIIHPPLSYDNFLKELAGCHISAAPFPFGNTNSTVDACALGLPVIAMKGSEPRGYTDYLVLKQFAVDDMCVFDSVEDYKNMLHKLIAERQFYNQHLMSFRDKLKSELIFFDDSLDDDCFGAFLRAVWEKVDLYKSKHHRVIRWLDGRVFG